MSGSVTHTTTNPAATAPRSSDSGPARERVRYVTALAAAVVGVLYLLIALQVIIVADTTGKASPFVPMMAAAVAFWLGAVLLVLIDRRLVWLAGVVVQLVVLVGYVAVAPSRTPHFEAWGLLIKAVQVLILGLLLYMAVTSPRRGTQTPT